MPVEGGTSDFAPTSRSGARQERFWTMLQLNQNVAPGALDTPAQSLRRVRNGWMIFWSERIVGDHVPEIGILRIFPDLFLT